MDYYGYVGRILKVDLTSGKVENHELDTKLAQKFLGGWGMNCILEYDHLKPGIDPLSPDNPIIIGVGPLCGTLTPASGKCTATMKLPIQASKREKKYIIATAVGGSSRFAAMIKNAGYDHVVITGRAKKPSYLKIVDDDIEICDARDFWSKKDVYETSNELADRHKGETGKAGTWVIGRAGENLLMASQGFVDSVYTMGRWGGATVLGSKNLKAVVALGTKGVKVANPKRFMALVDRKRKEIMSHPSFGTLPAKSFLETFNASGNPLVKGLYPGEIFNITKYASYACMSCIAPCKHSHEIKEGRFTGDSMHGQALCIYDVEKCQRLRLPHYGEAMKLVNLLDRAGMCIFTGMRMLNFVTRLFERGVISTSDTGGLKLKTGDIDSYIQLLEKFVNREDIGEYMAQGWFVLSERVGVDASTDFEDGVPIVRGSGVLHDIRWGTYSPALMLGQVVRPKPLEVHQRTTSPAGEDIKYSLRDVRKDLEEKTGASKDEADRVFTSEGFNVGRLEKHSEDATGAYNSLGTAVCGGSGNPGRDIPWLSEIYSAATGFDVSPKELKHSGERVWNMDALLNVREGIIGEDYDPPKLWLEHTEKPIQVDTGDYYATDWLNRRITKEDMYQWLDDYYNERGWDQKKRIPTREKLEELGLEAFINILEPYGARDDNVL